MLLTAKPDYGPKEVEYVTDCLLNRQGPEWDYYILKCEEWFREYLGREHAIMTSSCTGALQVSLHALGIGPGDEVIVPESTRSRPGADAAGDGPRTTRYG